MAGGATVTESDFLVNRVTGERREVDVVIRLEVGPYPVMVCVEATSGKRRADSTWKSERERTRGVRFGAGPHRVPREGPSDLLGR